jgi:glycosyltransferase involved in cell wall biosynthesis
MMTDATRLSIVVPLYNEEEVVERLVEAVKSALLNEDGWELLLVDDGSVDDTAGLAGKIAGSDPRVRLIRLARNYGQTAAMQAGFDHARGSVIVSMDGDLQNDPRDIPLLVEKLAEGYDLVAGYRERRRDKLITRKIPSRVANILIGWATGVPLRDSGCSLKAYRRELLERVRLYSELHRFIPAVSAGIAGARIAEVSVRHHPRRYGRSKYGLSRVARVLGDMLVVIMIRSFRHRPLVMFASASAAAAGLGFVFAAAAGVSLALFRPVKANSIVLPGAALLWFGLAAYLVMLGLVGEVAVRERLRSPARAEPLDSEELL